MTNTTIEWTTKTGAEVIATITHVTTESVYADGYNCEVPCDKVEVTCSIPSMSVICCGHPSKSRNPKHIAAGAFATIGRIGFSEDIYNQIIAAIAEFTPTKKEVTEPAISRGTGWCEKCESYCFGDCDND